MAQFSILLFIWSKVSVRGKVLASDFSVPCRFYIFPASAQLSCCRGFYSWRFLFEFCLRFLSIPQDYSYPKYIFMEINNILFFPFFSCNSGLSLGSCAKPCQNILFYQLLTGLYGMTLYTFPYLVLAVEILLLLIIIVHYIRCWRRWILGFCFTSQSLLF